ACGRFVPSVIPVSCSVGLLVGNILYTHSVLDLDPDRRAGKKTLAVLLGNEHRAVWGSGLFMLAIYASVLIGVFRSVLSPTTLLVFLSLPLAVGLWHLLWIHAIEPDRKVERAFWMGPMENWDIMLVNHLDWFMIRWFLSRNLMVLFCGLLAVSILLERVFVP
ncbi:MAG: prenyltransferase, partial [Planctomycetia bacterium]|nr:prenyltransferase [Planctomycetia bacterium]